MRRLKIGAVTAAAALLLCGCSATVETAAETAQPAPTSVPVSVAVAVAVTDQQSCEAFGDVTTILHNTMVALREERMTHKEYESWLQLATRVLDRVPTSGEGEVSEAIATLKDLAPAIPAGTSSATDIGTGDWYSPVALADACEAANSPLVSQGFTRG